LASDIPEPRIRQLERQVEELQFAVELFKVYGFQPKQYEELMKTLKESKCQKCIQDKEE
jgi:SPX domain protein involved in polyphosphate accumulation